jgi:MFS family permease
MSTRLWLAVLCGYFALGATIQALPAIIARGPATIGLLVTLAAAATAVARPFAGRVADRGRAQPVARAGALLVAAGAAGHLVAEGTVALAFARLTIGAGEGALFTGALASVLAGAPIARRGRLIGHFGLSMWGGLALGPPLAALVVAHTSPRGPLWLAAATAVAALALTAARDRRGAPPVRLAPPPRGAPPLLPRAAWRPGVVLGLASFGYGTVNAFAVLQAGAAALGVFAAAFLAVRLLGSRLVDDVGPRGVVVASAALEGVALGGVATGIAPLLALALAGAALALVFPALAVWVVQAAPERERGAAVGAMTSFWDVGIAAAGPVGALLVSPGHLGPAFALAAGMAALGAAVSVASAWPRWIARFVNA